MIHTGAIHPELLYSYTVLFIVIIFMTLVLTVVLLRKRRKKFRVEQEVQSVFDEWLSHLLMEDLPHDASFETPEWLVRSPKNRIARQYAIGQLISTHKNLIGLAGRNIKRLYEKMGLKEDSIAKFHSRVWHVKARGIYELYMMEQRDMQDVISQHTNHHNAYVRMEAQTAVLAFSGFEGLVFLDTLTRSLNDWQQLKLLEQLAPLDPGNLDHLATWLRSANSDVVLFALKLAALYQQLQVREDVILLLKDHREKLREQAIKTLIRVGDEDSPSVLVKQYAVETPANRKAILKSLEYIAADSEMPFLMELLDNGDPVDKLQAARILMKCCTGGPALLQERSAQQGGLYQQLFLHIKSELAR